MAHTGEASRVLIAVAGNSMDDETIRVACKMARKPGGKIYAINILEINRSLPLGAVVSEQVERAEAILGRCEALISEYELDHETELVQALRDRPGHRRRGGGVEGRPDRHGPPLQAALRRVQPRTDGALRAQECALPRDPLPGAPGPVATSASREPWLRRFRAELGSPAGPHDGFVKLIIVERIAKAVLLILLAISLIVLGRTGILNGWAEEAQNDLLLHADASLLAQLLDRLIGYIGHFSHITILGGVLILYASLEGAEGVGLAMHKRWAEYLTVVGSGLLIPYEILEVIRHVSLLKVGALLLNVAVVAYLAYKKRLFVDV